MSMIDVSHGNRSALAGRVTAVDSTTVSLHPHDIPPFTEAELERLYGNIYSSMKEWRVTGTLGEDASAYIEWQGNAVTTLYLFHVAGREIRVLNEGIPVGDAQAENFADLVFAHFPQACAISFHAVRSTVREPQYPHRSYRCLEDIVLMLPASADAYLAGLGGSTRSYVKRYLNKARRSFPSLLHEVTVDAAIHEDELREVVALNKLRMEGKGKVQGIDERELHRILALAKECGMLSVLRIDGKIRAGTINFRVGDNYFLEVIAHDPAYNDYRLGTLCCYLTIGECIARGGREYHFLWGPQDYKFRLGGVRQELDHLTIYRSRRHALLCPEMAWHNLRQEWLRKAREWLRESRKGGNGGEHLAHRVIMQMRGLLKK
jgi:hypothetical protein